MKKKLVLLILCITVLILVFTKNIYNRVHNDNKKGQTNKELILRDEDMITVGEALRLLGYFGIEEKELKKAADILIDESEEVLDKNYLNYKECLSLLKAVCEGLEIQSDEVIKNLSFSLKETPENTAVLTEEFLNMYKNIIAILPSDLTKVTEKKLFILGTAKKTEGTKEKNEILVTDQGNYAYGDTVSYENLSEDKEQDTSIDIDKYLDCQITAYVSGTELICITQTSEEETVLHNVWIVKGAKGNVSAFLSDIPREFEAKYQLEKKLENKIADLVIKNKKIVKISIKPDIIDGKVLVANEKYIEIDGYGRIQVDDNFKIYKIYNELSMEVTSSILVGYAATDFVVADGKIVAALIKDAINAKSIRVLIKTDNYENIFHKEVIVTADRDFTVTIGDKTKSYKKGEELTYKAEDKRLADGRIKIQTKSENGKIKLLSVKRTEGNPAYRGSVELSSNESGIIIINELPIEEYLYAVLPSEMPTSYGMEALKAQAICARSYAYNQLFANGYSEYGAHVDDSVSYQVYNNIGEDENSILAVKDTYGKVIQYDGSVITAFYFSTSCGHTASLDEVWSNYGRADYLVGNLQNMEDNSAVSAAQIQVGKDLDFTTETVFRNFIIKPSMNTYDSDFPWYRWKVAISLEELKQSIDNNLLQRYNANPELIKTLTGKDKYDDSQYESIPINTIGKVENVLIGKREESGILSELILVGSDNTVKVYTEYNIRALLAPKGNDVARQDGSVASGLSMLPSAFFVLDKKGKEITFQGGGYGHGVGMSQNGAKAMADLGNDCEQIIKHYYSNVELGYIY